LMCRLARELAAADKQVVTTTTTHIFVDQMSLAPARLVLKGERTLLARLSEALAENKHVMAVGHTIVETDKAGGLSPEFIDRLAAQPCVDAVIIEADGARMLPFKAPASHEPVIPASASIVVPVVGLDVLGRPLTAEHVHRPHLVARLTGAALGDPVTPAMIATVLAHPNGGAKDVPPAACLMPFLNKVENASRLAAARQIARLLLAHPRVDRVLIGAAQGVEPVQEVWGRVAAVVLAAGEARRYGSLKQLLPWHGTPLVAHVADQALACPDVDRVAVTVGAGAERVRAALEGRDVRIILVPDWAQGQSRSVQAGLELVLGPNPLAPFPRREGEIEFPASVERKGTGLLSPTRVRGSILSSLTKGGAGGEVSAVIFLLADQPGVSPELLSALTQHHRETLAPVVAPRYQGRRGNPVLFDRATFPEFADLHGDIGARPIIQAHWDEIAWVDWPTPEIIQDIDTVADYRRAGSLH